MSSTAKTTWGSFTGRVEYSVRGMWDRMLEKDIAASRKRGDNEIEITGIEKIRDANRDRRSKLAETYRF